MTQNTSSAVMAQRREPHDSLDDFPTPPWATRALMGHVLGAAPFGHLYRKSVLEPCCNRGFMARPLKEYFGQVHARDIHDYGWSGQEAVEDFLWPGSGPEAGVDWVIANPPFRLAERFIARAQEVAQAGVAMILRTSFVEGVGRWENLYRDNPPTVIAHFAERVVMWKGRCLDPDAAITVLNRKTGEHEMQKPSSATAYSWFVWEKGADPRPPVWIPPCRRKLTRAGDYEAAS